MLDLKEERKYNELRKLAQELHIPIPEAFWEIEVKDKYGYTIQRYKQRSHSWVRNIYNHLFIAVAAKNASDSTFGAGLLSGKDTGGVVRYASYPMCNDPLRNYDVTDAIMGILTPAGQDTKGIMVGSGVTAESFEDYTLVTKIANGIAAGQLSYVASALHSINYVPATRILTDTHMRYFNNNSGGNVSVNEVGVVNNMYIAGSNYNILMSRDLLAATVIVPNTGQLKVTYTIQLTYAG